MRIAIGCFLGLAAMESMAADNTGGFPPPPLPLTGLVLYTSGVGYFQRDGVVEGDASLELSFPAKDVNDILKSLILRDLDGGTVSGVTYASRDPLTRTLKSFSVDMTGNPSLAALLTQLRGEAVEIATPERMAGAIVGVERQESKEGPATYVLLLFTDLGLKSVSLSSIQSIRFSRKELEADLSKALALLASVRDSDRKKVVLSFSGTGRRRVRVGYVLETPVWKASYRLALGEGKAHLLQGWAVVENVTDEDWNGIGLTLVSGRPITFSMDLYQPLYVPRPEVQLELYSSLRPKQYDMDMETDKDAKPAPAPAVIPSGRAASPAPTAKSVLRSEDAPGAGSGAAMGGDGFAVNQGVVSAAQGSQLGEMFQYVMGKPVSIPRQQSALLPVVNQDVSGERFSVYDESVHAKHPLNGLKIKNDSGLHLMQGPVTVFDGGAYAGDAQLGDLPAGGEMLVTFSMDLDTEVEALAPYVPELITTVRIQKGLLIQSTRQTRQKTYSVKNRGSKTRNVMIEHPFDAAWTLVEPREPAERSRSRYRFVLPVAKGETKKLTVTEERLVDGSFALTNLQADRVDFYARLKAVSPAVRDALQKLLDLKSRMADTASQRTRLEARVQDIRTEQARIRENMGKLTNDSSLYKRYVKTLDDQETELQTMNGEIVKLRDQEAAQKKEADAFILSIDVK